MATHSRRVAVLIETSTSWGKSAVKGIVDYARNACDWTISVDWHGVYEPLRLPAAWRGEGIIARVTNQKLARQIKALGVPAVNVSWSTVPRSNVPQVIADERAIARLAAEHFLERGLRSFCYVGNIDQPHYVDHCGPTFAECVLAEGCQLWKFEAQRETADSQRSRYRYTSLIQWLKKTPKPVAVFAWDAIRGRLVADACQRMGLKVPEEVSVLVGYNDDLMCEISKPPLSGIDDCPERIGYAAAELLDRMMRGEKRPSSPQYISPAGIVSRQSTDTLAHNDPHLTVAISYIREHAHRPIWVSDVLKVVSISRRSLEQRFHQALGRSPAAEIRRMHLRRAKELLIRSDLPVAKIAAASGFLHPEVMTRAFRREFGVSPTAFRQHFRSQ